MAKPFSRIDGWPVAVGIVDSYLAMAAEFERVWGVRLVVTSGIRTYAEQEVIFRKRYTLTPGGRRVYDTRWWQGLLWYRIDPGGTVAQPGTSNHETGRSLDLRDTGSDPGVSASFFTPRNVWLSQNCHRWGFTHTGKNFGEPWHFEQLQVPDPFLGRGKPNSISPSDPGEPIGQIAGGGGSEDIMTPEQEKKLDQVLKYARRASNKSSAASQTAKWLKARIKGSVKQKSITTTVSEGRDTANWIQKRLKGSVEHGPSVTAMLEALLEEATGGDRKRIQAVQARAVEIDKTLDTDEVDVPDEVDEPIEDED